MKTGKSRAIATLLSIFPGAGHLYLGYQNGVCNSWRLSCFPFIYSTFCVWGSFLFLIPIIWFYSFFDGMQKASKVGREPVEDASLLPGSHKYQKWIGIGLIVVGLYYLTVNILIPVLSPVLAESIDANLRYWFDRYFQMAVLCILFIAGGIKLLAGKKEKPKSGESTRE